jgi:hypothetical protein
VKTLEAAPTGANHWTRASMATDSALSRSSFGRICKAFGRKPYLVDTFTLSTDPQWVCRIS